MRTVLFYFTTASIILIAAAASAGAFTNGVDAGTNLTFALTDYAGVVDPFDDFEIEAINSLHCIVRAKGRGPNSERPALRRGEMPLVLELIDPKGSPAPRTGRGFTNAIMPPKDPPPNARLDVVESAVGNQSYYVGYITNYFQITEPGTYVLEARLRYWQPTNQTYTWFLSEPARLPVVVRDARDTNAARPFEQPLKPPRPLPREEFIPLRLPVFGKDFATNAQTQRFVNLSELSMKSRKNINVQFNTHTRTNTLPAHLYPMEATPTEMAVMINAKGRPPENAWIPFQTNYAIVLPPKEGRYDVMFHFRYSDRPMHGVGHSVTLDTTAPMMILTNPPGATVAQCHVRLQGHFTEHVNSIRTSVRSGFCEQDFVSCSYPAPGLGTDMSAFDCKVDLSPGPNEIAFTCKDRAGNILTTNLILPVNRDNKPPRLALSHPTVGAVIKEHRISISGETDDAATAVRARIMAPTPSEHPYEGHVSHDGKFSVSNIPLQPGTNLIQLRLTDCAGFNTTTNLSIIRGE